MTDFTKTIQSAKDIVFDDGSDGVRVTFTDQSVVIWAVESERHAKEIQAMIGETISFADDEELPDYWISSIH